MNKKIKSKLEIFIEESEKIRKTILTKEDVDKINEISKKAEIEENNYEQNFNLPIASKNQNETCSTQP